MTDKTQLEALEEAMNRDPLTWSPLQTIEEARKVHGPIYLGGSRRMREIAGDEVYDKMLNCISARPVSSADLDSFMTDEEVSNMITIPLKPGTDYDYYATYDHELVNFLRANGFREMMGEGETWYDLDDEAISILSRTKDEDDDNDGEMVQVVLRKDAEFYKAVFDNIDVDFYKAHIWKSSGLPTVDKDEIQPIMNMLFAIGRAAQQVKPKE